MPRLSTFDFTASEATNTKSDIIKKLAEYTDKWCFQLEKGSKTGFLHYQGRMHLKVAVTGKKVLLAALKVDWRISLTSTPSKDNEFYVSKSETSQAGPWSDRDPYIPKQCIPLEEGLRPFQQQIINSREVFDARTINFVHCPGGRGKSTFTSWAMAKGLAYNIQVGLDYKSIMESACSMFSTRRIRDPGLVLIDIPRQLKMKQLSNFLAAIETIKDGRLVDNRYKWNLWMIDSPQIWVFCNTLPDRSAFTNDRWKVWNINPICYNLEEV